VRSQLLVVIRQAEFAILKIITLIADLEEMPKQLASMINVFAHPELKDYDVNSVLLLL